jgi:hypothetical protein
VGLYHINLFLQENIYCNEKGSENFLTNYLFSVYFIPENRAISEKSSKRSRK